MAGEVRGKVYEAITKVALEKAILLDRKGESVHWHKRPSWISVEPDFTIGRTPNDISALIMVTHSTSEKLSEKKFWRNIGELLEWKVQGVAPVPCYGIVFNASIKPALLAAEASVTDGLLDLTKTAYGQAIIGYVAKNSREFGGTDDSRAEHASLLIDPASPEYDASFASWIADFTDDLRALLKLENHELSDAWTLLRTLKGAQSSLPLPARTTYVRNGVAKLLIADDATRPVLYESILTGTPIPHEGTPKYLHELALVSEELEGCYIQDSEIKSAVQVLGPADCERVIQRVPARMGDFIDPLRSIGNIEVYSRFVVEHFDELASAEGMKNGLLQCYQDPVGIIGSTEDFDVPPRDNWLFVYCMTLEKAEKNKIVAYGLSNLAADTGFPEVGAGGFVIPPFVHRDKLLPDQMLKAIAAVFAGKIANLGKARLSSLEFQKRMRDMIVQRQRYILSTYRNFDPLAWLIQSKLNDAGIATTPVTVPSFVKEIAGTSSATSGFLRAERDSLIYWQSVTEAGRVHKTKELSARFRATKVRWDGKRFGWRSLASRIFLVVDGEWRDDDLKIFLESGVTQVFYPDQIDLLAAALRT